MKGKLTLIRLCFLIAMKESLFLILAPFFPEQLKLRGINDHYFAPLFTSYSVFFFLTCLSAGRFILPNLGRSKTLRIGLILHVLACICFVLIFYTNDHQTKQFLILGFAGRISEGIGAGLLQTAAYSELMQQYKDQENMIVGYLTFSGGKLVFIWEHAWYDILFISLVLYWSKRTIRLFWDNIPDIFNFPQSIDTFRAIRGSLP